MWLEITGEVLPSQEAVDAFAAAYANLPIAPDATPDQVNAHVNAVVKLFNQAKDLYGYVIANNGAPEAISRVGTNNIPVLLERQNDFLVPGALELMDVNPHKSLFSRK
jgi:hypothetical protein